MLYVDYTQKMLNLQGVLVKKVSHTQFFTIIDIEMPVCVHSCPNCGSHTSYIHDYRQQLIRDIPAFGTPVVLNYRRRRYRCPHCSKCFSEQHPFVQRYWCTGILNSFDVPFSNGFTEGCNNRIKVLKRNAYRYRNFECFRKRILHMFNYKNGLALQGR